MPQPLILSLDIGSSSVRATLYTHRAQAVSGCTAQVKTGLQSDSPGAATLNPDSLLAVVVEAIDSVLAQAGQRAQAIAGVGLASLVSNVLAVDANGSPLTPIFTYADSRPAPDVAQLQTKIDPEASHQRTGCRLHSSYLPARLHWLQRTQPQVVAHTRRWLSLGEFLFAEFFGQATVSYSVASWSGLLNRHHLDWDATWFDLLGLSADDFSPLRDVNHPQTGLRSPWAERWPSLRHVPWFPAVGDGAAANVGSGCLDSAHVALTIGTSGAIRLMTAQPLERVLPGLWLYRLDRERSLLGGATTEGGNAFQWLTQTLKLPPPAELEAQLAQMPPGEHGLTVLPFFAGERAPGWRDEAQASLLGLGLHSRPVDIVRATLEGIACRFALLYQRLQPHLRAETQVRASGGALLNSPAWLQILSDALGAPLHTLRQAELTSRGVALLVLNALGEIPSLNHYSPELGAVYQPHPAHTARYQALITEQEAVYARLLGD